MALAHGAEAVAGATLHSWRELEVGEHGLATSGVTQAVAVVALSGGPASQVATPPTNSSWRHTAAAAMSSKYSGLPLELTGSQEVPA